VTRKQFAQLGLSCHTFLRRELFPTDSRVFEELDQGVAARLEIARVLIANASA
jgi:hypothetical protein